MLKKDLTEEKFISLFDRSKLIRVVVNGGAMKFTPLERYSTGFDVLCGTGELRCETYAHFLENYVPEGADVEFWELKKIEEE